MLFFLNIDYQFIMLLKHVVFAVFNTSYNGCLQAVYRLLNLLSASLRKLLLLFGLILYKAKNLLI